MSGRRWQRRRPTPGVDDADGKEPDGAEDKTRPTGSGNKPHANKVEVDLRATGCHWEIKKEAMLIYEVITIEIKGDSISGVTRFRYWDIRCKRFFN